MSAKLKLREKTNISGRTTAFSKETSHCVPKKQNFHLLQYLQMHLV